MRADVNIMMFTPQEKQNERRRGDEYHVWLRMPSRQKGAIVKHPRLEENVVAWIPTLPLGVLRFPVGDISVDLHLYNST
jgi:hypothetical protein